MLCVVFPSKVGETFSTWSHLENGYNDSDDDNDGTENLLRVCKKD